MNEIRVGLIGYGYSGATFHAPLIRAAKGLQLTRICSGNPEKVRQDFPHISLVDDPGAVSGSDDINLVVIATTNTTHHALAKQALLANKHVVLEKPFTVTVADAEELVNLAQQKNLVLSVFHNRRWDSDFLTARHCIESGLLGKINTYEAHFDRYRPTIRQRWREQDNPGSGCLYDLGSHLIDQALVLFGSPDMIACDIGIQRPGGAAADYFHLVLSYGTQRIILHSSAIVKQPGPRFVLHGDQGSFTKHGLDPQESALVRRELPGYPGWGKECVEQHGEITFTAGGLNITGAVESLPGSYESYYRGIVDAIAHGSPPPVAARDALAVIKVIELAMRSNAEKRSIAFE